MCKLVFLNFSVHTCDTDQLPTILTVLKETAGSQETFRADSSSSSHDI